MTRKAGSLLALFAMLSCTSDDAGSGLAAEAPFGTPISIDPQADLGLGVQDGDPDQTFHDISTPFLLPDGSIAIPTAGQGEIRIFDRRGVLQRTLGSTGRGPGEFVRLGAAWARGDTIEALDLALRRMTRFVPNAQPEVIQLDGHVLSGVGGTTDGWILLNMVEVGLARDNPRDQIVVYRFDRTGAHAADLARVEGVQRVSLPGMMAAMLFSPTARFAAWDDNLYVGDTLEPEIRIVDGTGAVTGRISLAPVSAPTPSAALEEVRAALRENPPADAARTQLLLDQPLPDRVPAFSDFLVDDEGFVWVRPYVPARDASVVGNVSFHLSSAGGQWDVYSPDGARIGSIDMPSDLEPYHVTASGVVGIARDEFGVERVRVHALTRR